jgi:PAS domain S-box-containing protein
VEKETDMRAESLMASAAEFLRRQSKMSITMLAFVLSPLLGVIDYLTGPEFAFSIFYLLPVLLASWFAGRRSGILISIVCCLCWLEAELLLGMNYSNALMPYWNAIARFGFFLMITYLSSALQRTAQALEDKATALSAEVVERKRAQEALRERELMFRLISENVADLIAFLDVKGTRLYLSPSYKEILGEPERLQGTDSFCDVHPSDRERIRRVFGDAVMTGLGHRAEYRVLGNEGAVYYLESQWSVIRDSDGKVANVVVVSRNVTDRKQAEAEVQRLSQMVIDAQEAERRRVARELHDGVNQILSSISFRMEAMDAKLADHNVKAKEDVQKARLILDKAVKEVRRISENLRPSELDALGLLAALRGLCDEFRERTQVDLQLKSSQLPKRFDPGLELTLFRIVQEALTNIEKHSRASEVKLELACADSSVTLNIRDNGEGFQVASGPTRRAQKAGMGLIGMKERVSFFGGSFSVKSALYAGTEIAIRMPLKGVEKAWTP